MIKKIVSGYLLAARTIVRFLILISVCLISGAIFVFPLWKLADSSPTTYTLVFSVLFFGIIGALIFKSVRISFLRDKKAFIQKIIRWFVVLSGLISFIILVLMYQRLIAAIVLAITFVAYGFLAFVLSTRNEPTSRS